MRCCGRLQAELFSTPVQLPAPWQMAAAAGRSGDEPVAELIQLRRIDGGHALLLKPLGQQQSSAGVAELSELLSVQAIAVLQLVQHQAS